MFVLDPLLLRYHTFRYLENHISEIYVSNRYMKNYSIFTEGYKYILSYFYNNVRFNCNYKDNVKPYLMNHCLYNGHIFYYDYDYFALLSENTKNELIINEFFAYHINSPKYSNKDLKDYFNFNLYGPNKIQHKKINAFEFLCEYNNEHNNTVKLNMNHKIYYIISTFFFISPLFSKQLNCNVLYANTKFDNIKVFDEDTLIEEECNKKEIELINDMLSFSKELI